MSLGQSLQQRQLQRLSPQQIQLMKLLQIPTAQIEQRVKEELEENPALEMNADLLEGDMEKSVEEMPDDLLQGSLEEEEAIPVDEFEMSNEELSEYSYDDEVADYKTRDDFYPELDNDKVITSKVEKDAKFKSKEQKNQFIQKFTFPNVKDGSIIEYQYQVNTPFLQLLDKTYLEFDIPIIYEEYVFDFPSLVY